MDDDRAALARCVGDVEGFTRDAWGRGPHRHQGGGPYTDLLDFDAVEGLLVATARRPTFRLVRDGEPLPVNQYTHAVRMGGTTVVDAADPVRIAALVADGATLVLQGLQRTWLPLARFCRRLERATSHPVQANAYLTPPGAMGLRPHVDGHDVIVLQVEGTKGWHVEGLGSLDLAAGDALYLARGTLHSARTQGATSLHITIGLLRVTYRQVLRRVLDQTEGLDDPLPLGYSGDGLEELTAGLKTALARLAERLADVDPTVLAAAEAGRAARRRSPLWTGQLRSVLATAHLDDATAIRRRPDAWARLGPGKQGRLRLELADRTLGLPTRTGPALEAILAGPVLRVADLVGLDPGGRIVLARRLVREGLLEVVTAPSG